MANTTKLTDRFLQIKGLDDDWSVPGDLGTDFGKSGINVKSITFHPSGASDVCIIKAGAPSQTTTSAAIATTSVAPEIFHVKVTNNKDQRIKYFGDRGQRMWPFIDISDWGSLSSAAVARVEFELA
jgi:hypothetical protein